MLHKADRFGFCVTGQHIYAVPLFLKLRDVWKLLYKSYSDFHYDYFVLISIVSFEKLIARDYDKEVMIIVDIQRSNDHCRYTMRKEENCY